MRPSEYSLSDIHSGSEIPTAKLEKHFRKARCSAESSYDFTPETGEFCCTDCVLLNPSNVRLCCGDSGSE